MINAAYLHIPFCEQICHYCDFNKFYLKNQPVEQYLLALEKEMAHTLNEIPPTQLKTIFVGGGTPTALTPPQLQQLLNIISTHLLPFTDELEYTFEGNPGELTPEKLALLKAYGVNRLSLGVQSFSDELLAALGRSHRAQEAYDTVAAAKSAGFSNISIDLMYGLPKQTLPMFADSLNAATELGIEHVSSYSLQVEPKTVFYNLMRAGKLKLPQEDSSATMYEALMDHMTSHGFRQYEISNFAKPGKESRHNLTYWRNQEYYGFGAGAHSYTKNVRRANAGPLNHYLKQIENQGHAMIEAHRVTKQEMMEEEMFLRLRTIEGVSEQSFLEKYNIPVTEVFGPQLEQFIQSGLLQYNGGIYRLTRTGKLLGNEVFQSFIG